MSPNGYEADRVTTAGGLAATVVAVVLSSCCALQMLLVFMGVSTGVSGLLGPLHALRPFILAAAALLLGVAWVMAIPSRTSRVYPVLALGIALLVAALAWTWWDPILQKVVLRAFHR